MTLLQVSVFTLTRCQVTRDGVPRLRKHVIAFPQKRTDLQQRESVPSNLQVEDVVHLRLSPGPSVEETASCVRARVCRIAGSEVDVLVAGETNPRRVSALQIQTRMRLPWTPADLPRSVVVVRRRIGPPVECLSLIPL